MLLFHCIVGLLVVCLLHYWPWCGFITLLMQLVHRVTNVASSSCYYSCYWFLNTIWIPLLFLCIVLLYCWLLFMLHVFWWVSTPITIDMQIASSDPLRCCMFPTIRYPLSPFTPLLVLLLVHHIIGVIVDFLCWLAVVSYHPLPLPCACGGTPLWLERKEK
jgi:hypothetical protein